MLKSIAIYLTFCSEREPQYKVEIAAQKCRIAPQNYRA